MIFIRPSGKFYEGQWRNGKMNGKGKFGKNGGKFKEGEWLNGKLITKEGNITDGMQSKKAAKY